jgi:hypothetical protein
MPTVQEQIDALTARVNVLDGQNLTDPALAVTTVLAAKDNGLETMLRQNVLAIEQSLNKIKADLAALKTLVNTHLGI